MACLLAMWCCDLVVVVDVLELSVEEEEEDGDSVAAGDEAVAGVWSWGIEPDCAITSPAGAIDIRAANIKVLRVVIDLSDLIKWRGHILKRRADSGVSAMI